MNRDILLGLVKRLVNMCASKLKVLITSATLDGEKVSAFFSGCPVLNVPGKLYPVEVFFSSERPTSYLESALKKAIGVVLSLAHALSLYWRVVNFIGLMLFRAHTQTQTERERERERIGKKTKN